MINLRNIKMPLRHTNDDIKKKILKTLKINKDELLSYDIVKKAIDSRKKDNIFYVYNFNIKLKNEKKVLRIKNVFEAKSYKYKPFKVNKNINTRPVIVGSGPAGLLAAIILAEAGLKPVVVEQGKDVDTRKKDIDNFFNGGKLDVHSNVQFGAGGAGTFSDGKLTTGVNDDRKAKFIHELILAGANEEIRYMSKPHLGTDNLIEIVRNMCKKIVSLGGEILYETEFITFEENDNKVKEIILKDLKSGEQKIKRCEFLILAIGHSARNTFYSLYEKNIEMKSKKFAVGVRVEHLQKEVNKCQYGMNYKQLDAASYKLNTRVDNRTVHTFCMCPGGVVVGAASEEKRVVTNGMSYYKRDEVNSNSALLVNVNPEDYNGEENPLNGIEFQRQLEEQAFIAGGSNYYAPAQKVGDFLEKRVSTNFDTVIPSYAPGVKGVNLWEHFPLFIMESLREGIIDMQKKVEFFKENEAVITAIESRSSSPITILRNENLMSNIYGIFPCGEGAGYAGGIVSAGIDGIRCAEVLIQEINKD